MSQESLILKEGLAMIGSEVGPGEPYYVNRETIRRFAEAILEEPGRFEEAASASGKKTGRVVAPLTFPLYNLRTGIDRDFNIPLKAPRRVRGGDEFQFLRPVLDGDTLRAQTKLLDVYEREGSTGKMVFIVTETKYINQKGETVMVNKATVVRR